MTFIDWTAVSAIATSAAVVAAILLFWVTRKQVRASLRQVDEAHKQVAISQQQLEVMNRQLKAEHMAILELHTIAGGADQFLFNSGNGTARNIVVRFLNKHVNYYLMVVIVPQAQYPQRLKAMRDVNTLPEQDEQMTVTYEDVLGNTYSDLYVYLSKINNPRWAKPGRL